MFSYLDPGTGSMIVTAIAGGAAGLAMTGKMGFRRLKSKITGKPMSQSESVEDDSDDEDDE